MILETASRWITTAAAVVALGALGAGCFDAGLGTDDCTVDGQTFEHGETFPAPDGCNTCQCNDGSIGCTLKGCIDTCTYGGQTYQAGDTFDATDGCNTCTCEADGTVSCTKKACPSECEYEGETYDIGATFIDTDDAGSCSECTCNADGTVSCEAVSCFPQSCLVDGQTYPHGASVPTDEPCTACECNDGEVECAGTPCVPCDYAGQQYGPGESFPAQDGCNTCTCLSGGEVVCTLIACVEGCHYDGDWYAVGESFDATDGCNTCSCLEGGEVACTDAACPDVCLHEGQAYEIGATWKDGCGECTCQADLTVACNDKACVCEYGGESYAPGDNFPAGDGCNDCTCTETGDVACTLIECGVLCTYDGQNYQPGQSFPAEDGCNTCVCGLDGQFACTKKACACDPKEEWWRDYVGESPETCALIDYVCPVNTEYFSNACGCGCEQDPSCPEAFDCAPPEECDIEAIEAQCPYSEIVLGLDTTFGCGAAQCTNDQMCILQSPGVCGGTPPGPDGQCDPWCSKIECGDFEEVCFCPFAECQALPKGCDTCECVMENADTELEWCTCDDSDGNVTLDCPGA